MTKEELDNKTIFDFCESPEVAADYNGGYETKEAYLEALDKLEPVQREAYRLFAIIDYADEMGKKELASTFRREYKSELAEFFNE